MREQNLQNASQAANGLRRVLCAISSFSIVVNCCLNLNSCPHEKIFVKHKSCLVVFFFKVKPLKNSHKLTKYILVFKSKSRICFFLSKSCQTAEICQKMSKIQFVFPLKHCLDSPKRVFLLSGCHREFGFLFLFFSKLSKTAFSLLTNKFRNNQIRFVKFSVGMCQQSK